MSLHIWVAYDSSWCNSFLDGSNNDPLPKGGRKFIGSMTELKKAGNFIRREVTQDTVMGILNRLIGDQRKLYQARKAPEYYFADIEDKVKFSCAKDKKIITNEIAYIRNISGSTDQNAFTGMIKSSDPAFTSGYSKQLWGVLWLDIENLCQFIVNPEYIVNTEALCSPLAVMGQLDILNKLKPLIVGQGIEQAIHTLQQHYAGIEYIDDKQKTKPIHLYCSALYLQLSRLTNHFDLSSATTKIGGISGISKRGFTPKDFMDRYTTGEKKLIWGNPYLLKERIKGEGEVSSILTKASGQLEIILDISEEKARELNNMIENAAVSSFYLGKKGLAYVEDIRIIKGRV